jgi:hypothetical protein
MSRKSYIQLNGVLYDKDEPLPESVVGLGGGDNRSASVMGDLEYFTSPIDGSVVRGRAGIREHCKRHGVVPTAELAGLPPKTMQHNGAPSEAYRQQTRQTIADVINSRSDLWRQFKG